MRVYEKGSGGGWSNWNSMCKYNDLEKITQNSKKKGYNFFLVCMQEKNQRENFWPIL